MNINQRPKMSVYIAISIDGYIAKKDDGLDWLESFSPPFDEPDEDYGFKKFLSQVDAVVMGKNTYKIASSGNIWPYEGKRVIVLSSTLSSVCDNAEIYSGNIQQLIKKLYAEGVRHIYVDGGKTISQFLNEGLINELIISIIPVILGSGIPLFSNIVHDSWCDLTSSTSYSNGLVQLRYEVKNHG
ncbi:MAG: dihydrofolate reductase [Gammaproteobacteria bacterium]|nr:dihydrofolate reductase [Gammaproteobacteria bacterium]